MSLLLLFAKIDITSKFVNSVAASCFAVYLLHTNSNVYTQYYIQSIKDRVPNYTFFTFISAAGCICAWYLLAILLDKLRIMAYGLVLRIVRIITNY
jgi:hypothetical protein